MFPSFVICSKYSRILVQPITENSGNFSRNYCKLRFSRMASGHNFSRACRQVTSFPALTVRPVGYKLFSELWLGFFAAFYKAKVVNIN